jgi:hypothetical protein
MESTETHPALGCKVCQDAIYSFSPEEALDRVAVNEQRQSYLYRCRVCGTFWDFDIRAAVPISEEKARQLYPQAFQLQ